MIGGDFELHGLPLGPVERLANLTKGMSGVWTASGRSAFALVLHHLQASGVRHVHLPAYLCESVLQPVRALGLQYSFYPVDADFIARPEPPAGAAVLLIHYFGWLNPATEELRAEGGRSFCLIEDACQALLSDWPVPDDLARYVFLSPRKFGPVPLGGWCSIQPEQGPPCKETEALAWQSLTARLLRGAYLAEPEAPVDFSVETMYLTALRKVETFLDEHPTCGGIPQIALKIIAGLDWQDIAVRRRANWQHLSQLLDGHVEPLMHDLPPQVAPLGYVVRLRDRDSVQDRLATQRIFCPVHWPLPEEVSPQRFPEAASLAKTCLTLPIDQRYGPEEMARIAEAVVCCQ